MPLRINPTTGQLDWIRPKPTFLDVLPQDFLPADEVWLIPERQQLLLVTELDLEGEIIIEGTLGLL